LLPGLHLVHEGDTRWHLEATSVDVLDGVLGEELLVAFCRGFAALDRLTSLTDMMGANYEIADSESVRFERNLHALALFVLGLLHEFQDALHGLSAANVSDRLSDEGRRRWAQLLELMSFRNGETIKKLRNAMAFHVGDAAIVRRGLRVLRSEGRALRILTADGVRRVDARHDFGGDAILAGLRIDDPQLPSGAANRADPGDRKRGLEDEDLERAYTEIQKAHFGLIYLLEEVFLDALREGGAQLEPLPLRERERIE